LTIEYRFSDRYLLPWSAFDPRFYEEVKRRTVYVVDPPLDDDDARPAIAAHVAKKQEYELRRLASALVARTGRDPKTISSIADLVTREAFGAILQFLLDRIRKKDPTASTSGGLFIAAQSLCNFAANWVKVGDDHLKVLRKMASARNPNPASRGEGQRKVRRGMTRKNRDMLAHFRDEAILARFLDLPAAVFDRILRRQKKFGRLKRKDAVALGWAFGMAFLQIVPVRPKNGSGTELGKNLIEQGAGSSRRVFVHWEPEEVKNGVELHFELTGEALEMFDLYMKHGRPLLCGPTNRYLFPGRGDRSKQTGWFSTQIAQNLERELGVRVTGQQFRHLTGFVYLLDHPGDYETVRQFLGHTNISTTVSFYAGVEMQDAAKALDKVVKKRRSLPESPGARSGPGDLELAWDDNSLPASLVSATEVNDWKARTGPSGILGDDGPAANWRRATIELNWRVYLLWLGWLLACDLFKAQDQTALRFSPDHVIAFIEDMRRRGNGAATILLRVLALERVMAVLAPDSDRRFLRTIIRNLPEARTAAAKRARLQETAVLVDLGIGLMRSVDGGTRLTRQIITAYRDGLMIALLALRPFRRGNFSAMELNKNLIKRGDAWWLCYDEDETKNGAVIEVPFPLELVPWLEKYLAIYRPLLAANRYVGNRLWLSYWYTAMDDTSVYGQIVARTEKAFGSAVNPHLFRHCLATSLAIDNPEIAGIAHLMLGNDIATCQREYNLAQTHSAGRRLAGAVDAMRDRFRRQRR
jgi:integrase